MSTSEGAYGSVEDERRIIRLLTRYNELLDTGELSLLATEVFTADAVADYNHDVLTGSRAIIDYVAESMSLFRDSAHILTNVAVRSCDGTLAEVTGAQTVWLWVNPPTERAPKNWQDFVNVFFTWDRLARTPDGWRVVEHRTRVRGSAAALVPGPVIV